MTVAIGLVCSDGVIVASDSMGSEDPIATKVRKVDAVASVPVVWTSSGAVYVTEELKQALTTLETETAHQSPMRRAFTTEPDMAKVRDRLREAVHPVLRKCYESALPHGMQSVRQNTGQHPFLTNFLFMGFANGDPWSLELAGDGQLNWHTDQRFYALGSGGPFATVVQGLMKHLIRGPVLDVQLGLRVAYRAIETTCDVSSAHVGLPVQLAVANADGARVLSEEEVDEVGTAVEGWRELEVETLLSLRQDPTAEEPPEEPPQLTDMPAGQSVHDEPAG